jgi:hypothetical protein
MSHIVDYKFRFIVFKDKVVILDNRQTAPISGSSVNFHCLLVSINVVNINLVIQSDSKSIVVIEEL